jgi:hypothetical protein
VNKTSYYVLPVVSDAENDHTTVSLLSSSPSFASYDPALNKISFNPTLASEIGGPHTVTVEVRDAIWAPTYSFSISILNNPPSYVDATFTTYADVKLSINSHYDVIIPAFSDPDGSAVTAVFVDTFAAPVGFTMAPDFSKVTISPTTISEIGKHTVKIELIEESGLKLYKTFFVTVLNGAPIFTVNPLPKYKVHLNEVKVITISEINDLEGQPITMTIQ